MELSPFLFGWYKLVKFLIFPFTWLCLLSGALTVLTFLPTTPTRQRWIRILATASLVLVFVFGNSLIASTLMGFVEQRAQAFDPTSRRQFDAIVVLGGGARAAGTLRPQTELSSPSMRRTVCGATLFREGWAPRLLLSGGDASVFHRGPTESIHMKQFAQHLGVSAGAITVETRSRTTYENAVESKRLLGAASVLLVTSAGHLPRALGLFQKQGFHVTGYPCGHSVRDVPGDLRHVSPFVVIPTVQALNESTYALNELVGTVVYWLAGRL